MKQIFFCSLAFALFLAGCNSRRDEDARKQDLALLKSAASAEERLELYSEESGIFYQRQFRQAACDGPVNVERLFRNDRLACFVLSQSGAVEQVEVYDSVAKTKLIYSASYDSRDGSILKARAYGSKGELQASYLRAPDGSQTRELYERGRLFQKAQTFADGCFELSEFDASGGYKLLLRVDASLKTERREFADFVVESKWQGVNLLGWSLKNRDGELMHSVSKSGSELLIETPVDPENGTVILQRWRCYAEDWNRKYYQRTSSELYSKRNKSSQVFVPGPDGGLAEIRYYQDGVYKRSDKPEPENSGPKIPGVESNFNLELELAGYVWSQPGWEIEKPGLYQMDGTPFLHDPSYDLQALPELPIKEAR